MKKWFNNLDNKFKVLIHLVLCLAFFIMPSCIGDNTNVFLYLMWVAILVLEIIFIVWHIQFAKNNKNQMVTQIENPKDAVENKTNQNIQIKKQEQDKKIDSVLELDDLIEENDIMYRIKYSYKEQLCFCENFDSFKLSDKSVKFEHDPTNEYDKETIVVKINNKKIGLMYKGDCRDILLKCLKNNKYIVKSFICRKDDENKKIFLRVGFYEPLDDNNCIVASLIKTSKKDILTEESRQEQVEFLSENERVYLEEDFESDGLIVKSDTGYELGEVSQSIAEKMSDNGINPDEAFVLVSELDYMDSGKTKIKLKIYF